MSKYRKYSESNTPYLVPVAFKDQFVHFPFSLYCTYEWCYLLATHIEGFSWFLQHFCRPQLKSNNISYAKNKPEVAFHQSAFWRYPALITTQQ